MRSACWLVAPLLLGGCFEIPPSIPPGYIGSQPAPGWPPLVVYDAEPMHPRNRWFHRAFSGRGRAGEIEPAHADEPFGLVRKPSAVDVAEWIALLKEISSEPAAGGVRGARDLVADGIFRSDLLAEASRLRAELPDNAAAREAAVLMSRLSVVDPSVSSALDAERAATLPPPLREGDWIDAQPPAAPGLAPSAADPRWTRVLRERGNSARSALLRLRVASNSAGAALLLDLAAECWELQREDDGWRRSVWRFDRAEWLQGREPWRIVPGDAEITIRSPVDPSTILTGAAGRLCGSCHCETPAGATAITSASSSQDVAVAAALAGLLSR
jgi:hypothetical protein